ncbi:hypothetical protein D9C73_010101 [Collichthys lucidus]|uniref:Uncharacterized protein n=1 Tax=Collichthys lucidus TaxID=240159 RepID=A0A4U5UMQ8_COLLU|nr:hypothetical protein D9C73_010101 [Collichthys lucidus]
MDRRVEDFLNTYGYSDESPKFEQMRFLVFLGMPVNALRAMGVPVKFIDDHKRLVEKTSGDCTWFYIQGPQRQIQKMQTKPRTMQRDAGVIARPKSPDFAYRTPVSAPAETEFATFQTRLGCPLHFFADFKREGVIHGLAHRPKWTVSRPQLKASPAPAQQTPGAPALLRLHKFGAEGRGCPRTRSKEAVRIRTSHNPSGALMNTWIQVTRKNPSTLKRITMSHADAAFGTNMVDMTTVISDPNVSCLNNVNATTEFEIHLCSR